jgi:hypothetical protein
MQAANKYGFAGRFAPSIIKKGYDIAIVNDI